MKGITVVNERVELIVACLATIIGIAVGGPVAFLTHSSALGVLVCVVVGGIAWMALQGVRAVWRLLTQRENGQANLLEKAASPVLFVTVLAGVGLLVGIFGCIVSPVVGL